MKVKFQNRYIHDGKCNEKLMSTGKEKMGNKMEVLRVTKEGHNYLTPIRLGEFIIFVLVTKATIKAAIYSKDGSL